MRTSYYYDPPGNVDKLVEGEGILCDYCGALALIEKSEGSTMIPMPCTPLDEEYGHEEGNIHAHPQCAIRAYKEMKEELEAIEKELKERNLI